MIVNEIAVPRRNQVNSDLQWLRKVGLVEAEQGRGRSANWIATETGKRWVMNEIGG